MIHKRAEILQAIAEDTNVKLQEFSGNVWEPISSEDALKVIAAGFCTPMRLTPKTIRIGDIDVPMPMQVAPEKGTTYWVVSFFGLELVRLEIWANHDADHVRLRRNLCHLAKADCCTHAEAIIKNNGGVL